MRLWSSLIVAGSALFTAIWGCGGTVNTSTQGTAGQGGGTTSTTSTTSVTTTTTTTTTTTSVPPGTGGAGGAGGGHSSFATAQPIDVNVTLAEDLGASGNAQYYVFTGKKGEALDIETLAQGIDPANPAPYDPSYIDTVISLYDATQQKIAENDDLLPPYSNDSDLFTVLPADGTYYLRVTDCWGWTAESGKQCALPKTKTHTAYSLELYEKDGSQANVSADPIPDPGNDAASATPLKYSKDPGSAYYRRTDAYGFFQGAGDVDVFSLTLPADVPVTQGRLIAYFFAVAPGSTADGSTEPIGAVTITDGTGAKVLAQVNGAAGGRIDLPAQAGTPYLLYVGRNDGLVGSNDFYVVFHEGGGSNPLEADDTADNAMGGAQALTDQPVDAAGYIGAYVSGDLTPAGTDVDYYKAAVPPNLPATAKVTASCAGSYYGSGLRNLTLTLLDQNGVTLGAATETANLYAYVSPVPIPAGAQNVYFKVTATSQDPVVTGTYYTCGISFSTQ